MKTSVVNLLEKISDFNQNQNQIENIKNNLIFTKIKLIKKELEITKKIDIKIKWINIFTQEFNLIFKNYDQILFKYGITSKNKNIEQVKLLYNEWTIQNKYENNAQQIQRYFQNKFIKINNKLNNYNHKITEYFVMLDRTQTQIDDEQFSTLPSISGLHLDNQEGNFNFLVRNINKLNKKIINWLEIENKVHKLKNNLLNKTLQHLITEIDYLTTMFEQIKFFGLLFAKTAPLKELKLLSN
ncbi:hypothetical protein [Spiroplasma eriocheiris]|uniref:Uncharacterized protein n=1 Tax=Spiroplasma eriocheiris TaxID=315358 RepID=A0A0H3XMM0_9MOLU|nr:hypothetical protein [Spiroplasma eriocheiris]AHF57779.1 hypothetical protein SPE_0651 [Spiroplasma eriocheiris CCTCC M 207170]AKM54227.1 hypothetical protein SERIO_v1c06590 [Spiroplasma eriocheiris]